MQLFKAFFALVVLGAVCAQAASAQLRLGAQGAEGEPNRRQQWLVPSPDPGTAGACAAVSPARRRAVSAGADRACHDAKRAASRPNAAAGIPRAGGVAGGAGLCRAGAGTAGPWRDRRTLSRGPGRLRRGRLFASGHATADQIAAALNYLRGQSFIRPDGTVIVGHSAGAWGALALAGENPQGVAAIIAFAPGRGGHANDFPNQVCAPHTLISAAAEFGKTARVPVTWLVAANDSYFSPELSRQMADAFRGGGDKVDFRVLPASGSEGHWLAETDGGEKLYGPALDRALKTPVAKPARKR